MKMDDDFGDIYADVEVPASSAINSVFNFSDKLYREPQEEDVEEEQERNYNNNANQLNATANAESLRSDLKLSHSTYEKSCNSEEYGSDSEDEFNIVLNDEDCKRLSVAAERNGNRFEEDENLNPSANGHVGERVNDSYNSQYQPKLKQYGLLFPNNSKVNDSVGMASSSKSDRGDQEDNRCKQHEISNTGQLTSIHATANSAVSYGGYGFSLPWYRTILDVNIDAFEEKRWRYPGADISDFFNFGFNEDSWKQYCISLEQLRQHSYMCSRFPYHEFSKLAQACEIGSKCETETEDFAQARSSSKLEDRGERLLGLPKGRAIQVENGTGERQPTMDLRRARVWDSDVVIQISVQDPDENCSGSGKNEFCHLDNNRVEASKIRDLNVDDRKDGHDSSSSNAYESLGESLEERRSSSTKRFLQPILESNQMALDPDDHDNCHKVNAQTSEDIAETIETVKKAEEENNGTTCKSDQCLTETELSGGDRSHFSLTLSCSESDSEASEDSVHSMPEVSRKFLSRQSSDAMLLEPDAPDCKSPKSNVAIGKPNDGHHYLRCRNSTWEGRRHRNRQLHGVAEVRNCPDTDSDASPMSRDQLSFDSYRQIERTGDFGYHNGENFNWQREYSGCYGSENFAKNHFQDHHTKRPHRRYHHSFRHEVEPQDKRIWIEEDFYEKGIVLDDRDDMDRDWDFGGRGLPLGGMIPPTYQRSKRFIPKYKNFNEREIRWRRKFDNTESGMQTNDGVCLLDHKNVDYDMPHQYRRSILFNLNMESFNDKHIPSVRRKACRRRVSNGCSPPGNLENQWHMEIEDGHWDLDYQHLSYWPHRESYVANKGRWKNKMPRRSDMFDPRLAERYEGHGRELSSDTYGDNDWDENYYDFDNADDCVVYTNDWAHRGRRKYRWQSQTLHQMEGESILRERDNESYAIRSSCLYEKSSRHEHAKYRFANGCTVVDDVQLKWRNKTLKGENSAGFPNRNSNMMCRGEHVRTARRCNEPIDLICGEGKYSGRCSDSASLAANDKFAAVDPKFKDQKVSKDFNGTHTRKATKHGISKIECGKDNEKWSHKFLIREQNEDLEIEEGQIVPQESIREDRLEKKHASGSVKPMQNTKKRVHSQNASSGNEIDKGYDEQRILETLAKMERRRQRFKDPIALKREPDLTMKPQIDPIAVTDVDKQERPARRRRWGGS